jgi:hypothetical protein
MRIGVPVEVEKRLRVEMKVLGLTVEVKRKVQIEAVM